MYSVTKETMLFKPKAWTGSLVLVYWCTHHIYKYIYVCTYLAILKEGVFPEATVHVHIYDTSLEQPDCYLPSSDMVGGPASSCAMQKQRTEV